MLPRVRAALPSARVTSRAYTPAPRRMSVVCKMNSGIFRALVTLDPNADAGDIRRCSIEDLAPGMVLQEEVRSHAGDLLVSKGHEVTPAVIFKLKNYHARKAISASVTISLPTSTLAFVKGAS
jgi:hypothetical protein